MQQQLKGLIQQKDQIQGKLIEIDSEIKLINETKNLQKNLVDAEGFPRADLDFGQIANYRSLKKQRAMLNTDHCAIMKQIQAKIHLLHESFPQIQDDHEIFAQQKNSENTTNNFNKKASASLQKIEKKTEYIIEYLTPFAIISLSQEKSPSFKYGIRTGDLLSEFANINIYTIDNVKQIPKVVKEGTKIKVITMRQETQIMGDQQQLKKQNIYKLKDGKFYKKLQHEVIPEKWEGRGLLGCKIDPLH